MQLLHHRFKVFPITQPLFPIENRVCCRDASFSQLLDYFLQYLYLTHSIVCNTNLYTRENREDISKLSEIGTSKR